MEQKNIKLKYLFKFGKGLSITKENLSETGIPCVSYGQVHSKYGVILDMSKHVLPFVSENYLATSSQALIKQGDFVFADTSEDKGGSGNFTCLVSDSSIFAGYHTVIAHPISNDIFYKYFAYLFDSQEFRAQIQRAVSGIKVFTISQGMLKNAVASFPSFEEQVVIADHLDRKIAQIDNIIADKEKLIELLKEKRQAIISEAVTRGLDPSAPMKDSGVDWIGEVPAHWGTKKFKYLGESIIGLTYSPEDVVDEQDGVLVLRAGNIQNNNNKLSYEDNVYVSKTIPDKLYVRKNDLLICARNGSRALIGKNLLLNDSNKNQSFGAFMMVFRSPINEFLYYVFNSKMFDYLAGSFSSSTVNQLTTGNLNNMIAPIPPEKEQNEIIDYLKTETGKIWNLVNTVQQQISLLKEYRQSIISEAVTGKVAIL